MRQTSLHFRWHVPLSIILNVFTHVCVSLSLTPWKHERVNQLYWLWLCPTGLDNSQMSHVCWVQTPSCLAVSLPAGTLVWTLLPPPTPMPQIVWESSSLPPNPCCTFMLFRHLWVLFEITFQVFFRVLIARRQERMKRWGDFNLCYCVYTMAPRNSFLVSQLRISKPLCIINQAKVWNTCQPLKYKDFLRLWIE